MRETYIGTIEAVGSDIFPQTFDYVALGHYHLPSVIKNHIRYCGSPIPMGFGEARQKKCVYIVDFKEEINIETIEIPMFQNLESIKGDKTFIQNRLSELRNSNVSVWVEILYKSNEIFPDLSAWVSEQTANSKIEVLNLQNLLHLNEVLTMNDTSESPENLNTFDVFDILLEKNNISDEQKETLKLSYKEILDILNTEN